MDVWLVLTPSVHLLYIYLHLLDLAFFIFLFFSKRKGKAVVLYIYMRMDKNNLSPQHKADAYKQASSVEDCHGG